MKKLVLVLIVLVGITKMANAQKGTYLLYGNVGVNSQSANNITVTNWNITPGIGYQFADNWTTGLDLGIGGGSETGTPNFTNFKVGPFIRYSYSLSNIFSVYAHMVLDYETQKYSGNPSANGFYGAITPAISANVKNGFAINFNVGSLSYNTIKPSGGNSINTFNLGFGQGVGFGVSKNFGGKK